MLKLTYSNLEFQNFPGEDPWTPLFKGRGREGRGKGREGGRGRIGNGGEGRVGTRGGKEGGRGNGGEEGRGGEGRSTWAPPP